MNNKSEILEEILKIEKSLENIQGLMEYDNEGVPIYLRDTFFAHLNHLVKQKNEIKRILNS